VLSEELKGKRLAAVDFGFKRLGVAVCDELHISITPLKVFDYSSKNFWEEFTRFLSEQKISAIVVGFPYREDGTETEVIREINHFIARLSVMVDIPIYKHDESFSTIRAQNLMLELNKKKKDRRKKENKDLLSAAIILRDFIYENNL